MAGSLVIILLVLALAITSTITATGVTCFDKEKLGKLVIKTAPVPEGGFADPKLEDTVKDLKKNHRNFVIVDDEAEADFLIIVVDRKNELRSPAGSVVNNKTVFATLSLKENGNQGSSWSTAAVISGIWLQQE